MDRWTYLKVTTGQTLILASERAPASVMPAGGLSQLVASPGGDSVLRRVTIVAAHPDSTMVYLRADYAAGSGSSPAPARTDAADGGRVLGGQTLPIAVTRTDPPASYSVPTARADPYGSNRGISLYASTQRMSLETVHAVHVDVHA